MKNRKIIALLCAMAMIVTTLSSIFVVTAAAAPTMKVSISDEKDAEDNYTITVGYTGATDLTIGSIDANVKLPEGATFVDGSIVKDAGLPATALTDFNYEDGVVKFAFITMEGLKSESANLYSFKVKLADSVKNDIVFAIDESATIGATDAAGEDITYAPGDENTPLATEPAIKEYIKEQGEEPAVTLTKTVDGDVATITVSYDFTKANVAALNIGAIDLAIELPTDLTFVDGSITKGSGVPDGSMADGNFEDSKVKYGIISMAGITAVSGDLVSFQVKAAEGATGTVSVKVAEATFTMNDGGEYSTANTDENTVFTSALKIKLPLAAEPTEAPTVEPTQAPTVEPTQAPTVEPTEAPTVEPTQAPTAEPTQAPSDSDDGYSIKAKLEKTTVDVNGTKVATYNIDLSQIGNATMPEKVNIILQGWDGRTAAGNVIINNVDTNNMSNLSAYVDAKKVTLLVIDAEDGSVVAKKVTINN